MLKELAVFMVILGPLQGFLSLEIEVFQIPEVHATTGSDVFLPCTYNVSGVEEATIGSYKWYRNLVKMGQEVSDSNKDFSDRMSKADAAEFIRARTAYLTLHNVDPSHSGKYICQVTFQHGKEISAFGNGTLLNVTDVAQNLKTFGVCIMVKTAGLLLIALTGLFAFLCSSMLIP
ncbi:natural cytotoxicity triggering receptor 3-like [Anomaloglossus baeobatrachus]|uniref:natural cytotoxicity triggering receptor 3-like n=1 Tax=Anomaloglossus baeobatrachus TaxID=238106 RepID=UPI003F5067E2